MPQLWVSGWNQSGYMPEAEPYECDTWEAARDALVFEIERYDTEDGSLMDEAARALAFFASPEIEGISCQAQIGSYLYWIESAQSEGE